MSLMPATYCCGCPCDECTSTTCYNYYLVVYRVLYEQCPDSPFIACGSFRNSYSGWHMTNSCTPESAETIRQLYTPGNYYPSGSNLAAEGVYNSACNDGPYKLTITYECYLIHSTTTAICPQVWVSSRNEMITSSYTINTKDYGQLYSVGYSYYVSQMFEVLSDVNDPNSVCNVPFDQSTNNWYVTINTNVCSPYDSLLSTERAAHIIKCCT